MIKSRRWKIGKYKDTNEKQETSPNGRIYSSVVTDANVVTICSHKSHKSHKARGNHQLISRASWIWALIADGRRGEETKSSRLERTDWAWSRNRGLGRSDGHFINSPRKTRLCPRGEKVERRQLKPINKMSKLDIETKSTKLNCHSRKFPGNIRLPGSINRKIPDKIFRKEVFVCKHMKTLYHSILISF